MAQFNALLRLRGSLGSRSGALRLLGLMATSWASCSECGWQRLTLHQFGL